MTGKLVRDRIPDIIRATGLHPVTRQLTGGELVRALRAKVDEELAEFDRAEAGHAMAEELADVIEALSALGESLGISADWVSTVRAAKAAERGTFLRGLWLE